MSKHIKTWVERLPDGVRFCPSTTEMIPAMRAEITELRAALATPPVASGAPIDPNVQGMADCMDMVRQELIEAGVINSDVAPMFIANAVVAKLAAAAAPNAALVSALSGLLEMYVRGSNSGDWGNWDPEEDEEVIAARAALAQAGEVAK